MRAPKVAMPILTKMYVGNHLINARYNYSMIQERIYNYVIFQCQEAIKEVKNGKKIEDLDIFNNVNYPDTIQLKLQLSKFGTHEQYEHIRESMRRMCALLIEIPVKGKNGTQWNIWQGLFLKVASPEHLQRSGYMVVDIDRSVASKLVEIQRRPDGTPINYSTFLYEICINAKNKYTARLYKLISSWQTKGGFYISVEEFREYLKLGSKYKDTNAIRTRILKPVSDELKENADLWFNVSDTSFDEKEGKKVTGFNFKIINVQHSVNYRTQVDYFIYLLRTEYKIDKGQIETLRPIFENTANWDALLWRINKINQHIRENKSAIKNIPAYVTQSIVNQFKG